MPYFGIAGRNKLVLSPEEEFAMTQGRGGHPEEEGYGHSRFEGLEHPHGEHLPGHREGGASRHPGDPPARSLAAGVTVDELKKAVADGTVDTVLLAIADMEGRLQGKRLTATHFLNDCSSTAPRAATTCSPSTSTWKRSAATRWPPGTPATATSR